jgi:hypothetical protein
VKQDRLFTVQKDMKAGVEAQLAQVLAAQQSSQAALLAALAARPAPAPAPARAALLLQAAQQARSCQRRSPHDNRAQPLSLSQLLSRLCAWSGCRGAAWCGEPLSCAMPCRGPSAAQL